MTEQELMLLIKKIDNESKGVGSLITLMGWFPKFDEEGRPLNADPNTISIYVVVDGNDYTIIKKGWLTYYFVGKKHYLSYSDKTHFHCIDNTPEYLKK